VGATATEAAKPLAGDDVLAGGRVTATNAVTIDAAPDAVWPWIAQLGRGRAGFYTYTWIEHLLGADIHNLDHIEPAFQTLGEGDRIWLTPERYLGRPGQYWRVRQVQPGRALVLEQRPPANPTACTWALVVEPSAGGGTRLLSRHCEQPPRGIVLRLWIAFMGLGAFVMERKVLLGIKQRAERNHPALTSIAGRENDRFQEVSERPVIAESAGWSCGVPDRGGEREDALQAEPTPDRV
jgi:hypothetical protein